MYAEATSGIFVGEAIPGYCKKTAYEWAVEQAKINLSKGGSAASACHEVTEKFGIQVLPDTVRKLIKTNNTTITKSGPKAPFLMH